jgi:hypothetical protein
MPDEALGMPAAAFDSPHRRDLFLERKEHEIVPQVGVTANRRTAAVFGIASMAARHDDL